MTPRRYAFAAATVAVAALVVGAAATDGRRTADYTAPAPTPAPSPTVTDTPVPVESIYVTEACLNRLWVSSVRARITYGDLDEYIRVEVPGFEECVNDSPPAVRFQAQSAWETGEATE